jgi:hypothetical protein
MKSFTHQIYRKIVHCVCGVSLPSPFRHSSVALYVIRDCARLRFFEKSIQIDSVQALTIPLTL